MKVGHSRKKVKNHWFSQKMHSGYALLFFRVEKIHAFGAIDEDIITDTLQLLFTCYIFSRTSCCYIFNWNLQLKPFHTTWVAKFTRKTKQRVIKYCYLGQTYHSRTQKILKKFYLHSLNYFFGLIPCIFIIKTVYE